MDETNRQLILDVICYLLDLEKHLRTLGKDYRQQSVQQISTTGQKLVSLLEAHPNWGLLLLLGDKTYPTPKQDALAHSISTEFYQILLNLAKACCLENVSLDLHDPVIYSQIYPTADSIGALADTINKALIELH